MKSRQLDRLYSRRRLLVRASQVATVGLLTGCATTTTLPLAMMSAAAPSLRAARPPLPPPFTSPYAVPQPSLDVKIGQMLMIGFRGQSAPDDSVVVRNLRNQHVGSVVLFEYNTTRTAQSSTRLKALTSALQAAATIPLLIAIDQEGGQVDRLRAFYGYPATVSAGFLGALNDLSTTQTYATTIAATLLDHGINLNLAPVVDVNANPSNPVIGRYERSFSQDPETVARHAAEFIRAHHAQGVLCTLKHFPGHGSSSGDTHYGFVDVTGTWSDAELTPYQELIHAGLADAIMTAHIFNAKLDDALPATLSHPIITGVLRQQLGYGGVIVSDDMQMSAISKYYDFETAVQAAVIAGVDVIAIANNLTYTGDAAARAHGAIRRLVDDGLIGEDRIDQSYRRVMALKQRITPAG